MTGPGIILQHYQGLEIRTFRASETTILPPDNPISFSEFPSNNQSKIKKIFTEILYVHCFSACCRLSRHNSVRFKTVWQGLCCLKNRETAHLLYVPKFGQLNHFADNLKSWSGCTSSNQFNYPNFVPCYSVITEKSHPYTAKQSFFAGITTALMHNIVHFFKFSYNLVNILQFH